jgi:hypothetical protein
MTQELIPVLDPISQRHVEGYAHWLMQQARQYPDGGGEWLYELKAETNFARKLCRVDFATHAGDNAPRAEYASQSIVGFQPMQGEVDGVMVQLTPFRWDNVIVEIPGAIWDKDTVIGWFNRWFGFNGETPMVTSRDKPGGVIHICAWSEPGMLRLDMGSAPGRALAELVDVAKASGARAMNIRDVSYMPPAQPAG